MRLWPLLILFSQTLIAEPLGNLPRIDLGETRFIVETQSDLWTSPYQQKDDPFRRYELALKVPLVKKKYWNLGFTTSAEGIRFGRPDLIIGNDAVEITTDLRTQKIGLGSGLVNPDGSWLSVFADYESSSNEPFKNKRDKYFTGSILQAFAPQGSWQWLLGVNQSLNRGFMNGKILPIAGFFLRPDPALTIALGFPFFMVEWRPELGTALSLISTPLGAEVTFRRDLTADFFYELKTGLSARAYLHTDRLKDKNRIIFEERHINGGIGMRMSEGTTTVVTVGQSFSRRVYEAEEVFRPTGKNRALATDTYGLLRLEFAL